MLRKKMNTVLGGEVFFGSGIFLFALCLMLALMTIPRSVSVGLFFCSGLMLLFCLYLKYKKCLNYIYVYENRIENKNKCYSWDEACLTMPSPPPSFINNSYGCCLYIDNHYLSEKEIKSKEVERSGFYIIISQERLNFLLEFYSKPIEVIKSPINKKLVDIVTVHNFNSAQSWKRDDERQTPL